MPDKAEDDAGLTPSRDESAFWRTPDRKELMVLIGMQYQTVSILTLKF